MNGLMIRGIVYQCIHNRDKIERFTIELLRERGYQIEGFNGPINTIVLTAKDVVTCLDEEDPAFDGLVTEINEILEEQKPEIERQQTKRLKIYEDERFSVFIVLTTEYGGYDFKSLYINGASGKINI